MVEALKFWDGVAAKYAKSPIKDMPAYEYTLGRTKSYLTENDRVLEVGCGTGSTALLLAADVAHITATDLSGAMLDEARAKAGGTDNITFQQADVANAPEGPFDAVLALNLLHLIPDTDAALAQIRGRLTRGGLFISKTPCNPTKRAPIGYHLLRMAIPLMQLVGKAPFVRFMDAADWDAKIAGAGFDIIESSNHPSHPPSRYLVARKR